ncbi:MFS transporter [Allobranchiibius sp. GilTou73]|uniref:MFS transporter n=1 Tax=Allobranchiibius sp. GilTou73 TaxID=2904523 RepID=UPI001F2A56AC|nr:MFS transporter [Allobranchiibius sp. GilTou73]UIJ36387.1 MFS transporter [Allobranchiibius sp. GilTou73]
MTTATSPPEHALRRDHEAPLTPPVRHFLRKMTVATGGGMFIDGFVFATFAAAMAGRAHDELHVTGHWDSWISASVLIGTFFGGLIIGYITDKIGRKPMFTFDLILFSSCAFALFFVQSAWQVFVLGVVMGVAVGGDYAIGSPLLGEFSQKKDRGNYLGLLEISWNVGYVIAYIIGYAINSYWPGGWRLILGASVVPAVICLVIRHGLPESPRWLMSKGRDTKAKRIYREELQVRDVGDLSEEEPQETNYRLLFSKEYIRRTLFVSLSWSAIVMPYFALTFFGPTILKSLGLRDALFGALLGTIVALIGATISWKYIDRVGRRPITIIPMFVCAVFLFLAALNSQLPLVFGVVAYFGYLFSYGIMSITTGIYPSEVFPSSVRASGLGVASSTSRVAAAIGTFMLPIVNDDFGTPTVLVILGAVSLGGGIISYMWAPETNGQSLTESSHRDLTHRKAVPVVPTAA